MGWGYLLLIFLLVALVFYTVVPDVFLHRLGIGSWMRQYTPGVALTFDDGPDPDITPKILEVLKKHQVRATFFVVAERAQKYPELIQRIEAEGHTLGLHSLNHHYAWFASPGRTSREWQEGLKILEQLTNQRVTWMRPPWGTFNLMTWWWTKKNRLRIVLWNAEGHDWLTKLTPEEISQRILKRANEGAIVVMHDSGAEQGSQKKTVLALEKLCEQIVQDLKLPLVPLEFPDWSLGKRLTFRVWEKWEHYYAKQHQVVRINASNIFRLEKSIYEGPSLYAEDGRLLAQKGDLVAEIHLDNIRLQAKGHDPQKIALKALRQARDSFPDLARYIAADPAFAHIKVFMGETLLYRGVKGFGFKTQPLPDTAKSRGIAWLQKMIMRIYHPEGKNRKNDRMGDKTMLVWTTREKLLEVGENFSKGTR